MLVVSDIWKTYQARPLLAGISFQIEEGQIACLLGPSGSGKSTLLRIIAGLESPEKGSLSWKGENLMGVPVHRREFGFMFQEYALFPHRTVVENVAFGLRMRDLPKDEIRQRVDEVLQLVNLASFAERRVTDLSGGEQQRVALARALAPRPRLLMLDEPLGALDRTLRESLLEELRRLLRETHTTAIYVTHDQEEAFTIADKLILLSGGTIIQQGKPEVLYETPINPWAAEFLGMSNLVTGKIVGVEPLVAATPEGNFTGRAVGASFGVNDPVRVLLKPASGEWMTGESFPNGLSGIVRDVVFREGAYRVNLVCSTGKEFTFYSHQTFTSGQSLRVSLPSENILIYPQ